MKLNNLTYIDPAEGGKGLPGGSILDREIWEEFEGKYEALADASEPLLEEKTPSGPTTREATIQQRRHQSFFRKTVLGSYENRCCITGINATQLLRASHIIPWSESKEHRLNPQNGLCLSGTYDMAFDQFLISFDSDHRLMIGKTLKAKKVADSVARTFFSFEGQRLILPEKNLPNPQLLKWHRDQLR